MAKNTFLFYTCSIEKVKPIRLNEATIPVFLYREKRGGYRASFTKKGLAIRIPRYYTTKKEDQIVQIVLEWAHATIAAKPQILRKYHKKVYENGTTIQTFDKTYTIQINYADRKTIGSKVIEDTLQLILPRTAAPAEIESKHISRALAKHYKAFFQERLNYWNKLFPKQHKDFRFKYNSSNWGSCSTTGNINLSTRLILCPLQIIDCVIVHELSHLIHPNHSKQFWDAFEEVMPDYKIHNKWLKTKGAHLDF